MAEDSSVTISCGYGARNINCFLSRISGQFIYLCLLFLFRFIVCVYVCVCVCARTLILILALVYKYRMADRVLCSPSLSLLYGSRNRRTLKSALGFKSNLQAHSRTDLHPVLTLKPVKAEFFGCFLRVSCNSGFSVLVVRRILTYEVKVALSES
jgi:hypothetical protein